MRRVLPAIALLLPLVPLRAQWGIGPKAGIDIGHLTDHTRASDSQAGLMVGVCADLGGAHVVHLQPEVVYTRKGYAESVSAFGYSFKTRVAVDYIDVPLTAKAVIGRGREKLLLEAGGYVGFALGVKVTVETNRFFGGTQDATDHLSPDEAGLEPVDYGLHAGAGLAVPMRNGLIQFEARYQFGLADVMQDSGAEAYHRGVMLTLGYLFSMARTPAAPLPMAPSHLR